MTRKDSDKVAKEMENFGYTVTGFTKHGNGGWGVCAVDTTSGIPVRFDTVAQWAGRREAIEFERAIGAGNE